jgi:uncharacterized protein with HEPN domain
LTPSERFAKCFGDLLDAISLIEAWVEAAGGADRAICHDIKTHSAIERQLLVISEGAIRLDRLDPTAAPRLAPGVDWSGIRGSTSSGTSMMTSMRACAQSTRWKVDDPL